MSAFYFLNDEVIQIIYDSITLLKNLKYQNKYCYVLAQ